MICASRIDAGLACLQDFLKEVDLQFLDHMRRGTSINFADLASDPPPATMQASHSIHYAWHALKCGEHGCTQRSGRG